MKMKKLVVTLSALAAFTGSALAADMAPRYSKAPPPAPVAVVSWTGCYLGAGGGGGMYNNDSYLVTNPVNNPPGNVRASSDLTQGGRGWLATVQGGCDYQFGGNWVVGAFADADWTSIRGDHTGDAPLIVGLNATDRQTLNWQWAVGARLGYLVFPSLLTYVSAGYTEANMSGATYRTQIPPLGNGFTGDGIPSRTYRGWFIGTGDEYSLANWLPGLFWKTEYRYSRFDSQDVPVVFTATGLPNGFMERSHFSEQMVRSELVYRFNWGGAVVAKY
jgi:outer membrane immunogenic protein